MYSECGCWLQRSDGQPKAKRVKSRKGEQKKEGERVRGNERISQGYGCFLGNEGMLRSGT
jgi:hypothetical protein